MSSKIDAINAAKDLYAARTESGEYKKLEAEQELSEQTQEIAVQELIADALGLLPNQYIRHHSLQLTIKADPDNDWGPRAIISLYDDYGAKRIVCDDPSTIKAQVDQFNLEASLELQNVSHSLEEPALTPEFLSLLEHLIYILKVCTDNPEHHRNLILDYLTILAKGSEERTSIYKKMRVISQTARDEFDAAMNELVFTEDDIDDTIDYTAILPTYWYRGFAYKLEYVKKTESSVILKIVERLAVYNDRVPAPPKQTSRVPISDVLKAITSHYK